MYLVRFCQGGTPIGGVKLKAGEVLLVLPSLSIPLIITPLTVCFTFGSRSTFVILSSGWSSQRGYKKSEFALNPKNNRHSGARRNLVAVSILNGIPACAGMTAERTRSN
jgi:hypothetical protein